MTPAAKRRLLAAAAALSAYAAGACATTTPPTHEPWHDGPKPQRVAPPEIPVAWTAPTPRPPRASRNQPRGRSHLRPDTSAPDSDFWARLAACESGGRLDPPGYYVGTFQFSPDTAAKLGVHRGDDYATQQAAAERWSHMVDPASRAGWPVCWRKAMA
jgi:hypothetical protein